MRELLCMWILAVVACSRGGSGPIAIAYDKEPCAYCKMLIGDPHFAAQIVDDDGEAIDFDDPGCLMRYAAEHHPHARAIWFRDSQNDRWLSARDAHFVKVATSPMGWGYAAVSGAGLGYDEAFEQVSHAARPR